MPQITGRTVYQTPPLLVTRLELMADEFDDAGRYYAKFSGEHNWLLSSQSRRAASQLRIVADRILNGRASQQQGYDWLRAGWRIISAIGRQNIT
jgi:hypothetical protein